MVEGKRAFILRGLMATTALVLIQSEVLAGGFALREQSAQHQGSSIAGAAAGGSLSSAFWNPATMSSVRAFEFESVATVVIPTVEIDPQAPTATLGFGDSGDIGQDAFVPAAYGAYRLTDKLVLGLSVNGAFGLVTTPEEDWAGQTYSRDLEVFSLVATPMASYQVNDWLSLGAGLQIQYFKTKLEQATGAAPGDPSVTLDLDDQYGLGFTLGALLRPMPGTEIGIGFRSSIEYDLEGESDPTLSLAGDDISADLELPEMVSLGIRQRITDQFRLLGTAEWTNWSRLDAVAVEDDKGDPLLELPFEWEDGWFFSVGGEYDVNDRFTVRSGIGWELSPVYQDNRATRLPDNDRLWVSAGLSYAPNDRYEFDLGYSYIRTFGTEIEIEPDHANYNGLPFYADVDLDVHVITAGLKVKLGGGPAFEKP